MRVTFYTHEDGDWLDMFIDGKKVYGGHSISPYMLVDLLAQYSNGSVALDPLITWVYSDDDRTAQVVDDLKLGVAF